MTGKIIQRMQASAFWLIPLLAVGAAGLAHAQQPAPRPSVPQAGPELRPSAPASAPSQPAAAQPQSGPAQVERLFTRLKEAKTPQEAKGVASLITRRWARSGSDTVDLLAQRMKEAAQKNDLNLAMEIADRIVVLAPEWAEGWNQRAILFFRLDDPVRAALDLAETLKREPRHFVAMAGLAAMLQNQGKEKGALRAWREALAVYPLLEGAKEAAERLAPKVDGRDA